MMLILKEADLNNEKALEIEAGSTFRVDLACNGASTGYQWSAQALNDKLEEGKAKFGEPPVDELGRMPIGAPIDIQYTFIAKEAGEEKLVFKRARPWDSGNPSKTLVLSLEIK